MGRKKGRLSVKPSKRDKHADKAPVSSSKSCFWKAVLVNLAQLWKRIRSSRAWVVTQRILLATLATSLIFSILLLTGVLAISAAVRDKTKDRILSADELAQIEDAFDCILVLGCGLTADGEPSPMLKDRIDTSVELYREGICDTVLMSGDNQNEFYNEVGAMQEAAVACGIPQGAIQLDPAGLSTYDSIARMLYEYRGQRVVIVTQEYHLYRALYIAEKLGVQAYGVSATKREYSNQFFRDAREAFARCKDVIYSLTKPPYAAADN